MGEMRWATVLISTMMDSLGLCWPVTFMEHACRCVPRSPGPLAGSRGQEATPSV